MQGMLQHLLSKEILYPSLKELIEKYSEWLEEKKTTVSSNDLQRFTKQLKLMQQVIIYIIKITIKICHFHKYYTIILRANKNNSSF